MAKHEFIILEQLPACKVAFFASSYPATDVTNEVDIGPLFDLFFASAHKTHAKETGNESTGEAVRLWMGPARFHLPPTIRWLCRLNLVNGSPSRESLEMWMAFSDRVDLGVYPNVKEWKGGCFASVESGFDTTVAESWKSLERLLHHHDLRASGDCVLVENFQTTNHGGWDRYRVMIEVNNQQLGERGWHV